MEIDLADKQLQAFIKEMPKIELHAHLNGSLSHNTLQKLIDLKTKKLNNRKQELNLEIPILSSNDLSECFKVFGLIHKITDSPEAIYMATCDVIEDFYNDGIRYLELRTTPKESDLIPTQDLYVETVMKAIEDTCSEKCKELSVKLLLSIDRKRPLSCAQETLKIAEKYFTGSSSVIGIDLSGNPNSGKISCFLPCLKYAQKTGLKLAIHISEVPGNFEEVECLLKLQPDRLGHGTYLHPKKGGCTKNFEVLRKLQIPLECCLTSNVLSKTVSSYEDHHLTLFREMNYPCVLCTDDKGIFNTSLSNEYYLASKYYSLSKHDLFNLSFESIDYIFSLEKEKKKTKKYLEKIYAKFITMYCFYL